MERSTAVKSQSLRKATLIAFALVGVALLYYGWKKRDSKLGQVATSTGAGILFKALEHPYAAEILGPLRGLLKDQLAVAQKVLA